MTRINITDDMIEWAAMRLSEIDWGRRNWLGASVSARNSYLRRAREVLEFVLEPALDRRTGPKDRRVEWDDTMSAKLLRAGSYKTRRHDDVPYVRLPRKSDRLKREAEGGGKYVLIKDRRTSTAPTAPIQRGPGYGTGCIEHHWRRSGDVACHKCGIPTPRTMRLQEMKERGQ